MDKRKGLKIELSYVPVEAWGRLAKMVLEARRGDGIHIEGSIRSRIIESKGKPNRMYNWILAEKILMIDYTPISKGRKWKTTDAEWTQKMSEDEFYDNFPKIGE
jgi:single-stranded DNA-binding protein